MRSGSAFIHDAMERGDIELTTLERVYLADKVFLTDRALDFWRKAEEQAGAEGFTGVRAVVQLDRQLRSPKTLGRWMEYENYLTQELAARGNTMLCLYSRSAQPAPFVLDALLAHPIVAHRGAICDNTFHVPPDEYQASDRAERAADRVLASSRSQCLRLNASSWHSQQRRHKLDQRLSELLSSVEASAGAMQTRAAESRMSVEYLAASQTIAQTGARRGRTSGFAKDSYGTMVGELLGVVAHEVNQPLTALVTNAAAALRWMAAVRPRLDRVRQALLQIVDDGNRASNIIARIRASLGRAEVKRTPLSLNTVVQDVIASIRPELRRQGVTYCARLETHLPSVLGDRTQLQQVVLNLVMNAIEAMDAVGDLPRLLLIHTLVDVGGVSVCVDDSGLGLDEQVLRHMFEPFYTTKVHGKGIGLAISRSIIEAHGGCLWAERKPARGAIFKFRLPLESRGSG